MTLQSIKIDDGLIRLAINEDEGKIISFNPEDTSFADRFYALSKKIHEYEQRHTDLFADTEMDEIGLPKNSEERISLFTEANAYMYEQVNLMFGDNAAESVFGDTVTFSKFAQLVSGVTPYFSKARKAKTSKYTSPKVSQKASARTKAK